MKKLFILASALVLAGCLKDYNLDPAALEKWADRCDRNDGIKGYNVYERNSDDMYAVSSVMCNDGAKFVNPKKVGDE